MRVQTKVVLKRPEDNIMNIKKNVSSVIFASLVGLFFAANASAAVQDSDLSKVNFQDYKYGMKLDVKKVISIKEGKGNCEVVTDKMIYQDSEGHVKGVAYQVLSGGCSNG